MKTAQLTSGDAWVGIAGGPPLPPDRPPVPQVSGALAGDILREAAGIVEGARNTTHGEKERSFEAIAQLWNAYLATRKNPNVVGVSAVDVAWMMAIMKIARSQQGTPVRDHFLDCAGYAAIAGELARVK